MIAFPAITVVLTMLTVWTVPATASSRSVPPRHAQPSVCGQQVGAFRFALNDAQRARSLEPSVYGTILAELGPVAEACRLGDEAEAGKLLRALKRRWRFR